MKIIFGFTVFFCLVFPAFSQSASVQRFNALGDAMGTQISSSTEALAEFDELVKEDGSVKNYSGYKRRYDSLVKALEESEARMNFLLRTNDRSDIIREERDRYENLLNELQTVKSEYDNWLRTAQ